ncbi:hypothetical protein [Tenacibaculum ovolyticum]|uniref:hypothetical protein n=1 Tax=Tenacibaculum ovolyticum TaxID=104270 RepID=UPI003BACC1EB
MDYHLKLILDRFKEDLNKMSSYNKLIKKSIEDLEKEHHELSKYISSSPSIEVKPKRRIDDSGRIVYSSGIRDSPKAREVIEFSIQKRISELIEYIKISQIMCYTFLFAIFDDKHKEVFRVFFINYYKADIDFDIDKKLENFDKKSLSNKLISLRSYYRIDVESKLDENSVNDLIEFRETRNLYVHNGGLINEKYKKNIFNSKLKLGECREINQEDIDKATGIISKYLCILIREIDCFLKD